MHNHLLVVGAGIGGLAAALAASRRGWQARVFEQAQTFTEVGAGLQLGPNATRVLAGWGLEASLQRIAAYPDAVVARSAVTGARLASLGLGAHSLRCYDAPYVTVHRADLHALLLEAARSAGAMLKAGARVGEIETAPDTVTISTDRDGQVEADALVGADGIWSQTRARLWKDGRASPTGHLAYRGLVAQEALPAALRSTDVTVWLAPRLHAVAYPVRGGDAMNVVVVTEGRPGSMGDLQDWDAVAVATDLDAALAPCCAPLRDFIAAVSQAGAAWRSWVLCDRDPVASADALAFGPGPVALLGDAAHPMRPYLAQGAAMALEDAEVLSRCLALCPELSAREALARYATLRWKRVARVQARARRNGAIFHLDGPMALARDASLRLAGPLLMDAPWLYGASL